MKREILTIAIALGSVAAVACGDSFSGPVIIGRSSSAPPDTVSDSAAGPRPNIDRVIPR
jgi:hypothetical protein